MDKSTYAIVYADLQKELDGSSFYFEFQKGDFNKKMGIFRNPKKAFKLPDSFFIIDETVMEVINYFIPEWSITDIGYPILKKHGEVLIQQLNRFAEYLRKGESIINSLTLLNLYTGTNQSKLKAINHNTDFPNQPLFFAKVDLLKLANTAADLVNWLEDAYKTHGVISVLGV